MEVPTKIEPSLRNQAVRNKLKKHLNVPIKNFSLLETEYSSTLLEEQDFDELAEWDGYIRRIEDVASLLPVYYESVSDEEISHSKKELVNAIQKVYNYLKAVAHIPQITCQGLEAKYLHNCCIKKVINLKDMSIKICTADFPVIQAAVEDCVYSRLNKKRAPRLTDKAPQHSKNFDSDFTVNPVTVYVVYAPILCEKEHHDMCCVRARVLDTKGIPRIINVAKCKNCNNFFIHYTSLLQYHQQFKGIMLSLSSEYLTGVPCDEWGKEMHELAMLGYSVSQKSELNEQQRQNLLAYAIKNNTLGLTKHKIISHLNILIDRSFYNSKWSTARKKWERDLKFVMQLNESTEPIYNAILKNKGD